MRVSTVIASLVVAAAGSAQASTTLLNEGFDNVSTLAGAGWAQVNNSAPGGTTNWFQGNDSVFAAASGAANSYVAANFNNASLGGTISNWLITPEFNLQNDGILNFSLRLLGEGFVDTVQVYLSSSGASTNVGSTTTSTGDFVLLGTFSSDTDTGWQQQSLAVPGGTDGRLAFRYVVSNTLRAGDYVGIDSVSLRDLPEPASMVLVGLGLCAAGLHRRRAAKTPANV